MLDILFSDADIAVCIKPAGVLSQDAGEGSMPDLLRKGLSVKEVFTVHRLDREVGGVMVYALNQRSAAFLSRAVQQRQLEKEYLAVLRGVPEDSEAVLEDLLFHDKTKNKTYVVKRSRKGVKDAKLEYRTVSAAEERALVRVRLHTGRTHQIRVQFASRGLPLVGDGKYGGKEAGVSLGLWSCRLAFPHPGTGKRMEFEQLPPENEPWKKFT